MHKTTEFTCRTMVSSRHAKHVLFVGEAAMVEQEDYMRGVEDAINYLSGGFPSDRMQALIAAALETEADYA